MINSNHKIVEKDQDFQKWETIKNEIRKDDSANKPKNHKKRNEMIIFQERDQFYHIYPIIILWKEENQPTNKQMKEKERENYPKTKNQYEKTQ